MATCPIRTPFEHSLIVRVHHALRWWHVVTRIGNHTQSTLTNARDMSAVGFLGSDYRSAPLPGAQRQTHLIAA